MAADVKGEITNYGSGMGSNSVDLIVTNISSHTCTINGYGGLHFFSGGDGRLVAVGVRALATPGPELVTLRPGGTAVKGINWQKPPPQPPMDCAIYIGEVAFILPGDTQSTLLTYDMGPICGGVDATAYH